MSAGDCIIDWTRDHQVTGSHNQKVILCSEYTNRMRDLLVAVLRDPDALSSTDRNTILSAVHTPADLLIRTQFLIHELQNREVRS